MALVTPPAADAAESAAARPIVQGAVSLTLLWAAGVLVLLAVYSPALHGAFVSDDFLYVLGNEWIHRLDLADVQEILNPWGGPASATFNFAPVNLLLHGIQWSFFGKDPFGYHLTNIAIHGLVSILLIPLFGRARIASQPAFYGAAIFLLHPANVEAVAWVSQQKTLVAMALALGALLSHPRRPALATVFFALAILTKASAAFALPVAAWWAWRERCEQPPRLKWLVVWAVLLCLYAVPEVWAVRQGEEAVSAYGAATHFLTLIAFGARYTAMALTSYGVGPFHQPPLATSVADRWFLSGVLLALLFGWRAFVALRRGAAEGGFWIWAAIGYAMVSQIVPFIFPLADRYLYFILPGLIGAALLVGQEALSALTFVEAAGKWMAARSLPRGSIAFAIALAACTGFGLRSHAQAASWLSDDSLAIAAARGSPDGLSAHLLASREAARRHDAVTAAAELRAAADEGWTGVLGVPDDRLYAPLRKDPRFEAMLLELAGRFIEGVKRSGASSQPSLIALARAHELRGERAEQRAALERAIAEGGPLTDAVRQVLAQAERADAAAKRHETGGESSPPH